MRKVAIHIIETTDPSNFLARQLTGQSRTEEGIEFARLSQNINDHFNGENCFVTPYSPRTDDICIARHPSKRTWFRVQIQETFHTSQGYKAQCFFLDTGDRQEVPFRWLRHAPQNFLNSPFQVKRYCLHDVKPVTLGFDDDLKVAERLTEKWDPSAVTYMNRVVRDSLSISAEVVESGHDGKLYVKLYIERVNGEICLNEELVTLKYAVKGVVHEGYTGENFNDAPSVVNINQNKNTIQDYLKKREERKERHYRQSGDSISSTDSDQIQRQDKHDENILSGQDSPMNYLLPRKLLPNVSQSDTELHEYAHSELDVKGTSVQRPNQIGDILGQPVVSQSDTEMSNRMHLSANPLASRSRWSAHSDGEGRTMRDSQSKTQVQTISAGRGILGLRGSKYNSPAKTSDDSEMRKPDKAPIQKQQSYQEGSLTAPAPGVSLPIAKTVAAPVGVDSLMSLLHIKVPPVSPTQSGSDDNQFLNRFDDSEDDKRNTSLHSKYPKEFNSFVGKTKDTSYSMTRSLPAEQDCRSGTESSDRDSEKMRNVLLGNGPSRKPRVPVNLHKRIVHSEADSQEQDRLQNQKQTEIREELQMADTMEVDRMKANIIGRQQGKKLLSEIQPTKGFFSKPETMLDAYPSHIHSKDRVLVHSALHFKPCYTIDDAPLNELVKQVLDVNFNLNIDLLLAYAWPAISRGSHFVGIAPQDTKSKDLPKRRMLAYLPSLISQLCDSNSYRSLPGGKLPLAIILVPSSKLAREVHDVVQLLLERQKTLSELVIYGGGEEDFRAIALINGCDILIATPPCLNRMLKLKYTRLNRLCHLVIDEADVVLEEFTSEIKTLMSNYGQILQDYRSKTAPQQIILLGSLWTAAISQFANSFLGENKNVVITSCYEASIYGQVKQVVYMCKKDQRIHELSGIIEDCHGSVNKVIIFTSELEEAEFLYNVLMRLSLYVMVAHHKMDTYTTEQVAVRWNSHYGSDMKVILVCTDSCLTELQITDAEGVIHYNLPPSKTKFGNRLACMKDNYHHHRQAKEETETDKKKLPISYIMMNEDCDLQAWSIQDLLTRTKSQIPPQLKALLAGMTEGKENDIKKELCFKVKAFGKCRDSNKCDQRHIVLPKIDGACLNSLPNSGEVKLKVTHIVNSSHFHARLIEHRMPGQQTHNFTQEHFQLLTDMATWFGRAENFKRYTVPSIGDLCAIQENEVAYRVKIMNLMGLHAAGSGIRSRVYFIDIGRTLTVEASRLLELPETLQKIPPQAVNIFICRIRPIDCDVCWTPNADFYIHELLKEKVLDGRIALCMDNTLWLDPLVQRRHLVEMRVMMNEIHIRSELIKNGFAVDNPNHLTNLYSICEGKIDIPLLGKKEVHLETDVLPESEKYHEVLVSSLVTPDTVFVQRKKSEKQLEDLCTEISTYMETQRSIKCSVKVVSGLICLALFPEENKWYRAQVLKAEMEPQAETEAKVEVFFVDYGETRTIDCMDIHEIPPELLELPMQAIECGLAHIRPFDEAWTDISGDALWDLCHFVTDIPKRLVAQVFGKSDAKLAGLHRYSIELYDTSRVEDLNLAQELVWKNLAKPTSPAVKALFPAPAAMNKIYTSPTAKVADLCAAVHWSKDDTHSLEIVDEISHILSSLSPSDCSALVSQGGVTSLVQLIGNVGSDKISSSILTCVQKTALLYEKLSEELLSIGTALQMIRCLEQSSRKAVQVQAACAIETLAKSHIQWWTAFQDENLLLVEILTDIIDVVEDTQVKCSSCRALAAVCSNSRVLSERACDAEICDILLHVLAESEEDDLIRDTLYLMDVLYSQASQHSGFQKESLIQTVIGKLKGAQTSELIKAGVKFCNSFSQRSRKNKTRLLEIGLVPILKSFQGLFLRSCYNLVSGLLDSLIVNVPKEGTIRNKPSHPVKNQQRQGCSPEVRWSQNTFRLVLSIRAEGVNPESNPVHLEETSITFDTVAGDVHYFFQYDLYDKIQQANSYILVKAHEVLVSLRKVEKGKWSRLLHQKQKLPNISVDYERYVDSSSDSEVDEEEQPFLLKKAKQRRHLPPSSGDRKTKKYLPLESESDNESSDSLFGDPQNSDMLDIVS